MLKKFERYHAAQGWFAKSKEIHRGSRHQALELVCAKVAETLEVERVGIWFLTIDREAIYEEMTFSKGNENSQGHIILKKDFPSYFKYICEERVLAVNDTSDSGPFKDLIETYMKPFGIRSLLDAPIFSDGEVLGILCCESKGQFRAWDIQDKNFAASSADFIGRIIESEKRHTYEKELRHRINYLENDLKRKLDDLNEAKLSLDLALESSQVGKWDWDISSNQVALNRTWFTKLGYDYNEIPQEFATFLGAIHPEDLQKVQMDIDRYLTGETPIYECRYRMIMKNSEIQWCLDRGTIMARDEEGRPLRMTGVNVNVTPMVKWEESISISQQQLKAMIQSLPTPVAMFDKDLRYIAFSEKWKEEWGFFSHPKEGESPVNSFHHDWVFNMKQALEDKSIRREDELIEQLIPGSNFWVRWMIQPWKDAKGEIGGVIMMAENITNKKEAEIKLAQASKLSALGEMAGGIAHEINNPLSIIKGYIDLLRRHSSRKSLSTELLTQYIQKMDQTVGRISKIVSGMRRFSRESSMDEKVKYSMNKIVEETLDICLEKINNNGTALDVEYLKEEPFIYCRPVEISQVLLNLINNSFQAISGYEHPWIKIKMEDIGENYKISVIDNGDGISTVIRDKLFQPFFTTKDVGIGTGLGLSISRGIVEEHEGKLYYQDDAPNTTFVIELPKWRIEETQSVH